MPQTIVRRRFWRPRRPGFWLSSPIFTAIGEGGIALGGSADVEVFSTAQVRPSYVLEVDWDNDGSWGDPIDDISDYLVAVQTVTGRDYASQLTGRASPGKLVATLLNQDDRFSPFNTASPLFGLALPGRRVRLRDANATPADPVQLARDRFNRASGPLGDDEHGHTWQVQQGSWAVDLQRAVPQTEGAVNIATIDVGQDEYYAQVQIAQLGDGANKVGLVFQYVNSQNFSALVIDVTNNLVQLFDVVNGTQTNLTGTGIETYHGIRVGVHVTPSSIYAYVDGIPLLSANVLGASSELGLYAQWATGSSPPELDHFEVWDALPTETEGVFWTGRLSLIQPDVQLGPYKTARLEAIGPLAEAATARIAPVISLTGRKTGLLIGSVLGQAHMLRPPGPLSEGEVRTGMFVTEEDSALNIARLIEETEFGFLFETPEGFVGFEGRSARQSRLIAAATFSDVDGAQFGYNAVVERDYLTDIFNRVVAGVSPFSLGEEATVYEDPGPYLLSPGESIGLKANPRDIVAEYRGHSRNVDPQLDPTPVLQSITTQQFNTATTTFNINMPATVLPGDRLLVLLNAAPGPIAGATGWTQHAEILNPDFTLAVWSKVADGSEGGTQVPFTIELSSRGVAHIYQIRNASNNNANGIGTSVSDWGAGSNGVADTNVVSWNWGAVPVLVIAFYGTPTGNNTTSYPPGYANATYAESGSVCNLASASRVVVSEEQEEWPGDGQGAFTFSPSFWSAAAIAIRGPIPGGSLISESQPAGSNPNFHIAYVPAEGGAEQVHTNISVLGIPVVKGDASTVQVDDVASQDKYGIRTYRSGAALFRNTADAQTYANLVLSRYAEPTPVLSIRYLATKNASYYAQARRRRVGDRIRLIAKNSTGLGIDEDFFIEAIHHSIQPGPIHEVTYELSPASVTDA